MGYTSRFYIECIKHGWRNSIEQANSLGALFGGFILLLILQHSTVLKELGDIEAPTTIFGNIVFNLVMAAVSLALTWLVIFLVRIIFVAPAHLYAEARKKIDVLAKPKEGASPNLTVINNPITTTATHYHVHIAPNPNAQMVVVFPPDGTQLNPEVPNIISVKIEEK